jgi:predicted HD superfamily hydrolase involved in NAD metabolism
MPAQSQLAANEFTLPPARRAEILARLGEMLGPKRVEHSAAVADAARELALRFAPGLAARAELAGLVHDSAKKLRDEELQALAAKHGLEVTEGDQRTPQLLHGKVGAALLQHNFGIDDAEVAQAVADHDTGRAGMGTLSQLLFVADQIAAGREFPGLHEVRAATQRDLSEAAALVARRKIEYVMQRGQWLEPATVAVWNEFGAGGDQRAADKT